MKPKVAAIDIETTGLSYANDKLFLIAACWRDEKGEPQYLIESQPRKIAELLADSTIIKVFHNSCFDLTFLNRMRVCVNNFDDTFLLLKAIRGGRASGLKPLLKEFYGSRFISEADEVKRWLIKNPGKDYSQIPKDLVDNYIKKDVLGALLIWERFSPELDKADPLRRIYLLDKSMVPIVVKMQNTGIRISRERIYENKCFLNDKLTRIEIRLSKLTESLGGSKDINYNSSEQVGRLMKRLGYDPPISAKTGKPLASEKVLCKLKGLVPQLILERRSIMKLLSSFGDNLLEYTKDDILYCHFNIYGTITGRFSSSNPNMQNIPVRGDYGKYIRAYFEARPGCVLAAFDYSQIELRILAKYLKGGLLQAFKDGRDIHEETAALALGRPCRTKEERFIGKQINFALVYGMGADALTELLNRPPHSLNYSLAQSAKLLYTHKRRIPEIIRFNETGQREVVRNNFVRSFLGRKRALFVKERYKAVNSIIQAGAADVLKLGLFRASRAIEGTQIKMLLTIHDEVLFEVPIEEIDLLKRVKEAMEILDFEDLEARVDVSLFLDHWGTKNDAVEWDEEGTYKEKLASQLMGV
jgi:DNA polymerase-1